MNEEIFITRVTEAAALPALARHARFARLHDEILDEYLTALRAITPERAGQRGQVGDERRSILQVVGHIMEWDRFMILSAGDILAGVQHPRMVTAIDGYVDWDGSTPSFESIDAFNQYQAKKHETWTWEQMQAAAMEAATTLHILFAHPSLINAERLERTKVHRKKLMGKALVPNIGMGWVVWMTCLEHAGVEHTLDLGMPH